MILELKTINKMKDLLKQKIFNKGLNIHSKINLRHSIKHNSQTYQQYKDAVPLFVTPYLFNALYNGLNIFFLKMFYPLTTHTTKSQKPKIN